MSNRIKRGLQWQIIQHNASQIDLKKRLFRRALRHQQEVNLKKVVYIIGLAFVVSLFSLNAHSATRNCNTKHSCGNRSECPAYALQFTSFSAMNTWLAANRFKEFEVLHADGLNYTILYWENACRVVDVCWDSVGECVIP